MKTCCTHAQQIVGRKRGKKCKTENARSTKEVGQLKGSNILEHRLTILYMFYSFRRIKDNNIRMYSSIILQKKKIWKQELKLPLHTKVETWKGVEATEESII